MGQSTDKFTSEPKGLIDQAGVLESLSTSHPDEAAWIEVIHKMDSVYADLVQSQVELEKNHTALKEAQRFIRSVLASMTEVLIVCDIDGVIQQTNAAMDEITGLSSAEMCGQSLLTVFSDDLVQELPERVRSGNSVMDCEVSLIGRNGEAVPLAVNCTSRYNNQGKLVGLVLIGRPLGELRQAYKELDQAHHELRRTQQQLILSEKMAALGRLVAGVAHELNNPISFVFGNMHALKRYGRNITTYLHALDSPMSAEELAKMRAELNIDKIAGDLSPLVEGTLEGAERVSEIVHDLRRYFSAQEEPAKDFDLVKVIRTAAQWVIKTSKKAPEISFEMPERLNITGKKRHLHQIMVNLVQNSIDVMERMEHPRLEVACTSGSDGVVATVRDFGPGLTEEYRSHIFEPFYTTKPVGKGTGLGLYVSYVLCEEMGGTLRGTNHPDGGAVFTITLPGEVSDEL